MSAVQAIANKKPSGFVLKKKKVKSMKFDMW